MQLVWRLFQFEITKQDTLTVSVMVFTRLNWPSSIIISNGGDGGGGGVAAAVLVQPSWSMHLRTFYRVCLTFREGKRRVTSIEWCFVIIIIIVDCVHIFACYIVFF